MSLFRVMLAKNVLKLSCSNSLNMSFNLKTLRNKKLCQPICNGYSVTFSCEKYSTSTKQDYGTEIYHGPLAPRIRSVKLFSLATSFGGLLVQPLILQKLMEEDISIAATVFSGVIIQFFTFITPVLLHYITKRYVKTIYYNDETDMYTTVTYNFWVTDNVMSFTSEDVIVPDIPGLFTSIVVKKVPLFIEASYFEDLQHYKRLMGFDKPIDFKLEEKPNKE